MQNVTETKDRRSLLRKIQMCDFVVDEMVLYLDSHPNCQDGLEHYKKYRDMLNQATKEYVDKYGPLTVDHDKADGKWNWITGPWPWEKEAN